MGEENKRKLEIGPGGDPTPGHEYLDHYAHDNVTHVCRADAPLPFEDGVFDEVLAIHVLEHFDREKVVPALKEWLRILKLGGICKVHVPNARHVFNAFLHSDNFEDKWQILLAVFGTEKEREWGHKYLPDEVVMRHFFEESGFEITRMTTAEDRHTAGWKYIINNMSLVVWGVKK